MIRLLVFDLDGTILDTAPTIHRAANILLERHGGPPFELEVVKSAIGLGLGQLLVNVGAMREGKEGEDWTEFLEIYQRIFLEGVEIFPGFEEFLDQWDGKIAIYSNKSVELVRAHIENSVLSKRSWVGIFGGDSFEQGKPHRVGMDHILNLVGCLPGEVIMVGDSSPDLGLAQFSGVGFIGVKFGYGNVQKMTEEGAQHWVEHYSELYEKVNLLEKSMQEE